MNQYFFRVPFANAGDRTVIAQPVDLTGVVSFTQGWGPDYALDPATNASAQDIDRGTMNWLLYTLTLQMQQYQSFGYPEYIAAADNGGAVYSYAKNATVRYQPTPSDPWHVYTSKLDNNNNLPTVSAAWTRDDEWLTASQIAGVYATNANLTANYATIGFVDGNYVRNTDANFKFVTPAAAAATYLTPGAAAATYATIGYVNGTFYTAATIEATFERQSHAASTYLTQSAAAATYLTQSAAAATYATQSALSGVSSTASSANSTANSALANFANFMPNIQGSNSSQRGYAFGWYTAGTVTAPAGGTYFYYQIWFNGSGQALAGSSGFTAGGTLLFGGGATSFGWAIKVA